ncbi:uncharacterized protein PHALS_01357 [Plasmopara halstedii]|uniref:Uncharacterized protein n=1 Tax=Plasmopara halstedii TaxID=4781 RepID=A0A0P1AT70_PLAHL|nr:uncharacterized protein PHALS_01357 [Plasmopara halstedii]CEG45031.1 hypothetical protein PHALS_01357 [Plasmopara halstedii]|eukprot:XP_024581400.1 hypothetical protein PHALS_01357 [Plasmopara halstedii]
MAHTDATSAFNKHVATIQQLPSALKARISNKAASSHASPERRKKRQRSPSVTIELNCETSVKKIKKSLRWSTITIHEFGVGLGGSSVPGKGGPSIGLSDTPEFTWTTKVGEMAECVEGVHRFTPEERVQMLKSAGVSDGMILRFSREANIINCSRRRTVVESNAEKEERRQRRQQQQQQCKTELPRRACSSFLNRSQMIPVDYV